MSTPSFYRISGAAVKPDKPPAENLSTFRAQQATPLPRSLRERREKQWDELLEKLFSDPTTTLGEAAGMHRKFWGTMNLIDALNSGETDVPHTPTSQRESAEAARLAEWRRKMDALNAPPRPVPFRPSLPARLLSRLGLPPTPHAGRRGRGGVAAVMLAVFLGIIALAAQRRSAALDTFRESDAEEGAA